MDPNPIAKLTGRLGESSSLASLAAALWGATAIAPGWLAGAFGLDAVDWRAIVGFVALIVTLAAIARPEGGKQRPPAGGNNGRQMAAKWPPEGGKPSERNHP